MNIKNPKYEYVIRDALDQWFHDCEERMLKPTDSGCKPRLGLKEEKSHQIKDKVLKRK